MKNRYRNILLTAVILCMMAVGAGFLTKAAGSARISFSDVSCKVGETFTVNMSVNASGSTLAALDAVLLYPAEYLELISCSVPSPGNYNSPGGGTIVISWYDASGSGKLNCSLTFKSLKAGSTAVTVESQEIADRDGNVISSSAASSAITIGAGSNASSDAKLSSLQIAPGKLSPAFSPDRMEYSIQVNNDVSKIAVSAKPNSAKAKFVISSTDLSVGDNTITVRVTAEDGKTVNNYVIRVKRLEAAATRAPEPTQGSAAESSAAESEGPEDIAVTINGQIRMFVTLLDDVTLPEGYEAVEYEFDGHQIQAARSLTGSLIAFYLADQDGENPQFYLYNEQDQKFTRMMNIQTAGNLYTVVEPDAGVVMPDGYHAITVEIDGLDVQAWRSNDDAEGIYYLIYAMNWNGEKSLYSYDSQEKTMQRVDIVRLYKTDRPKEETSSVEDLQIQMENAEKNSEKDPAFISGWVIYAAAGFLILLILLAIALLFFKNKGNGDRSGGRLEMMKETRRRNGYEDRQEPEAFYEKNTGMPPSSRQEEPAVSWSVPTAPDASEINSIRNQLEREKEDDEFDIIEF